MLKAIFTLDYEIHGNGDGSPKNLLINPTYRLIDLFNRYGAKLSVFVDVAELLKFKEYFDLYGVDHYDYQEIVKQIHLLVLGGHDVQLHLHPSYFNAIYGKEKWLLDWEEYDLTQLSFDRINKLIKTGKQYLEDLIRPIIPSYSCFAFRSANWSMNPSINIVRALIENGFIIDTSVFKYGKRFGIVNFDYSDAYSDLIPWPISENNVCNFAENSKLFEYPIYAENRYFYQFFSINRLFRVIQSRNHKLRNLNTTHGKSLIFEKIVKLLNILLTKQAFKMDFNQCSGGQLINGLKSARNKYSKISNDLPFVLIGHSKLYNIINEMSLEPFLRYVSENPNQYGFGTFRDFLDSKTLFLENELKKLQ